MKRFCLFIPLLILVNACTHPMGRLKSDSADVKLAEAAVSIGQSLHKLALIEEAASPKEKIKEPPSAATYGMSNLASIDWDGPIEPLLRKLAAAATPAYKVEVLGRAPAVPVLVSLYKENKSLASIIRDIGYQSEKHARIVVFPGLKVVQLRYLEV